MEDEDTIDVFQSQTGGCFWSGNYFSDQNFAILGKWFDLLCLNDIAILRNTWQNYSNKIWWKNNIYRSQSMWEILFFCVFLFAGILKQKRFAFEDRQNQENSQIFDLLKQKNFEISIGSRQVKIYKWFNLHEKFIYP